MTYNYNKLKGKITEKFGTQKEFAKAMKITENSISRKLQNQSEWTQAEIDKGVTLLEIPYVEIGDYFFCRVG